MVLYARRAMRTFLRQLVGEGPTAYWLLLAICVARASSAVFGVVNIDETDFGLIARVISQGGVLYRDVVETKPPLVYLAYLPSALTHFSLWPARVVGVAVLFATCLVLRRVALVWGLGERAGWLCAWAGLLATLCEVPSVNAELLMNLPSALALLALVRARRTGGWKWLAAAGAWAGVASLVKHQAGILLVSLVVGAVWPEREGRLALRDPPRRVVSSLLLVGTFVVPWLLALAVWSALGARADFIEWNFLRNVHYVGGVADAPWLRLAAAVGLCVVAATPLLWMLAVREALRPWDAVRALLASALLLTWVPVSLGGRFYEHYFLQFAPPLALLAGVGADRLLNGWRELARWRRVGALSLLLLPVLGSVGWGFLRGMLGEYPAQERHTQEVAGWLRAHAAPGERLFVWGHYTPLYWLAQLEPGTRYLNTSVHMGNFDPAQLPEGFDVRPFRSQVDVQRTLEDLEARRPAWVVDTAPADIHHWSKVPLSGFPALEAYIQTHYRAVASPGGAVVYRRLAGL
jgi:4-amino-4-deoxy-L-arabinose transferase-like glycosyltransferase